jgi:hypothetical protein
MDESDPQWHDTLAIAKLAGWLEDPEVAHARQFQPSEDQEERMDALELAREQRQERLTAARVARAPKIAARKKAALARKAAPARPRLRMGRLWGAMMKGRRTERVRDAANQQELLRALTAVPPAEDEQISGNPGRKDETQRQRQRREAIVKRQEIRAKSLTSASPLANVAIAEYPKQLSRLVERAVSNWQPIRPVEGGGRLMGAGLGAFMPKKLSYYSGIAAKRAVQKAFRQTNRAAQEADLQFLHRNREIFAARAIPWAWVKKISEGGTRVRREIYGRDSFLQEVRGAAERLVRRLAEEGRTATGCTRMRTLAEGEETRHKCPSAPFTAWGTSLLDETAGRTGVRYLCEHDWPKLVCTLVRAQVRDWLRFAAAIHGDKKRFTAGDLKLAAVAAQLVAPLVGERFAFLAHDLVAPVV